MRSLLVEDKYLINPISPEAAGMGMQEVMQNVDQ